MSKREGAVLPFNLKERLYTVEEAAAFLRVAVPTIYKWVHHRKINYYKVGTKVVFRFEDLTAMVKVG